MSRGRDGLGPKCPVTVIMALITTAKSFMSFGYAQNSFWSKLYDLYNIKFCLTATFLETSVVVNMVHCTQLYIMTFPISRHGCLSPLTTAIFLTSFLTNEEGLGRYIANCIDINREVPTPEYFPFPGRIIISAYGARKLTRSGAGLLI